jgi:hypothetical protein
MKLAGFYVYQRKILSDRFLGDVNGQDLLTRTITSYYPDVVAT